MKTLCLNMIVKDEAANIERCLLALADHIACWVICDTGSTDATPTLIRELFAARAIPGELHEIAFETFGQARNAALDIARASPLRYDYLLLVDADMELTVADRGFARDLSAEVYMLRQDSGVAYWNARLLRRDAEARYVGVTHEYLDLKAGETRQLEGAAFIDHASGANRPGKARRDADMLRVALRTEQDPALRARYAFYLANSLRDDGDDAEALRWFLKRAEADHWHEEVFLSLTDAGRLQARLGHADDEVLATLERAANACPTRAEALHEAARFCRDRALHERGLAFARRAAAIPMPASGLFLAEWVYRYGILDELAVAAYWSQRYAESLAACDGVLAEPSLPAGERPRVEANRRFALDRLREEAAAQPQRGAAIPRLLHFIVGLDSDFGGKPFAFVHAMAIVSALRVNDGFTARVHYEFEPRGDYWEMVKPLVTCVPIVAPREFCGHPVEHFANRADICRLRILLEHGGIYLDIDTICQKPFAPLLDGSVVMGAEQVSDGSVVGLCNATVIAPPGAPFLKLWLDSHNDFTVWNRFAVQLPMQIAREHPELLRIEPHTSFFWPAWDEPGIAALFTEDRAFPEAFSFHLWESKSWAHVSALDAAAVRAKDTSYNRIARRFVTADWPAGASSATAPMAAPSQPETVASLDQAIARRRLDMQVEAYWAAKRAASGNPLLRRGEKFFSQSDEDGITLEICRRIGLVEGCALEFGVGDGLENNSLVLLLSGWQVCWVGGEALALALPEGCRNLAFARGWVTAENCAALAGAALAGLPTPLDPAAVNLLSIDLDGNDLYVAQALLAHGLRPDLVIVEYNGKFPPPIRWSIAYDAGHRWDGSDYQGASLQSLDDALSARGYRLVCCNLTGTNAFFVRGDHADRFADVPAAIDALFQPADYNWFVQRGHGVSARTIEAALRS